MILRSELNGLIHKKKLFGKFPVARIDNAASVEETTLKKFFPKIQRHTFSVLCATS